MLRRLAVVVLAGVAGCFSDVPPGASESTGGTPCTPGEVLCECRPDDTCDAGLACVPQGCIPDDCDPGTPMCTCLQPGDLCVDGWMCSEGLCREETSTTSGTMTTTPPATATTVDPLTTTPPPVTSDDTIGMTSDGMESGGPFDVPLDCNTARLCTDCAFCTLSNDCMAEYEACATDMAGCVMEAMCIHMCLAGNADLFDTCIMDCDCIAGGPALTALIDCTAVVCDDLCMAEIPCGS